MLIGRWMKNGTRLRKMSGSWVKIAAKIEKPQKRIVPQNAIASGGVNSLNAMLFPPKFPDA
jgi:hypothetical protein